MNYCVAITLVIYEKGSYELLTHTVTPQDHLKGLGLNNMVFSDLQTAGMSLQQYISLFIKQESRSNFLNIEEAG